MVLPSSVLQFGSLQRSAAQQQQQRGEQLAQGLYEMGLREGDVVAVYLRNCPQYADVVHACRIAGFYYCPINWHFLAAEVQFLLQDSGAKALISEQSLLEKIEPQLALQVPALVVNAANPERDYEAWLARQGAYQGPAATPRGHMAYTSGTTGKPKGVVRAVFPPELRAAKAQENRQLVAQAYGLVPGTRTLLTAPIYHSAPSLYFQHALMLSELVVLEEKFDAERFLALVQEYRIETAYMVPIMYVRLLRLPEAVKARYDISSLKFIASTGSPCAPEVKRAMIDWFGPILNETYASSESGLVTLITAPESLQRQGSAGKPLGHAVVQIKDRAGKLLPAGEVGLIYVHQPAYADFTYRGNEAARQKMADGTLITLGDMGYLDADGYLYVCDRDSDMIISGGVNIYPAEIEHALMHHPQVADCAVIGIPNEEYGESLLGMVEATAEGVTELALQEWLKSRLAAYKVPRQFVFEKLPRDDNGKIAKRRLREKYWNQQSRKV